MKYFGLVVVTMMFISCGKSDEAQVCFSFDIRQCQTDNFAADIPESDSKEYRENKLKSWLSQQDLDVNDVKLEIAFHDGVCEACHVCPQGDRYFVSLNDEEDLTKAEALELLNYETIDCSEKF